MIGGGRMITTRLGSWLGERRRQQSSHPSRQPSASSPTPGHLAMSSGRFGIMGFCLVSVWPHAPGQQSVWGRKYQRRTHGVLRSSVQEKGCIALGLLLARVSKRNILYPLIAPSRLCLFRDWRAPLAAMALVEIIATSARAVFRQRLDDAQRLRQGFDGEGFLLRRHGRSNHSQSPRDILGGRSR